MRHPPIKHAVESHIAKLGCLHSNNHNKKLQWNYSARFNMHTKTLVLRAECGQQITSNSEGCIRVAAPLHLISLSVLLLIAEASAAAADTVWGVARDCVGVKNGIRGGRQITVDAPKDEM